MHNNPPPHPGGALDEAKARFYGIVYPYGSVTKKYPREIYATQA